MNKKSLKDFWTIEWSESQQLFHIDSLNVTLWCLTNVLHDDWKVVALVNSLDEADKLLARMKENTVDLSCW